MVQNKAIRIGILSDTHGHLDTIFLKHLSACDEIWHSGDWGNVVLIDQLSSLAPLKSVWGNIDGKEVRASLPENNFFMTGGLKILIRHIGGKPPNYNPQSKKLLSDYSPDIFVTGHSHLLIVQKTPTHLHINPGAAGLHGFHKARTIVLMSIIEGKPSDLKVIELPRWA